MANVLRVDAAARRAVRAAHALEAEGRLEDALHLLRDWLRAQPHLANTDLSDHYLEGILISCKGSVEKAKSRIDKYCTMRTLMPAFFNKTDAKEFSEMQNFCTTIVCPRYTVDYNRIFVIKINGYPVKQHLMEDAFKYILIFVEYLKTQDHNDGLVVILDYFDAFLGEIVTKLNPIDLNQALNVYIDGLGMRIKAFHVLSTSKVVDAVVSIFKQVLSKKLGERFHVHRTLESLHEYLDKDLLPSNYGGKEKSLTELNDAWIKELGSESHVGHMRRMQQARSLEELRPAADFNHQYMGMPGSFRVLNVD